MSVFTIFLDENAKKTEKFVENLLHLIFITNDIIWNSLHDGNGAIRLHIKKEHNDWLILPNFKPSLTIFQFYS